MQIGFFDSGVGGITVLHAALKMLPNEEKLDEYSKLFIRLDDINVK